MLSFPKLKKELFFWGFQCIWGQKLCHEAVWMELLYQRVSTDECCPCETMAETVYFMPSIAAAGECNNHMPQCVPSIHDSLSVALVVSSLYTLTCTHAHVYTIAVQSFSRVFLS